MSAAIAQWRGFKAATRLGWEVSSNWTRPLIFVIYSVLRPLSGAFILVVMYRVISGGAPGTAHYRAFLVGGGRSCPSCRTASPDSPTAWPTTVANTGC